MSDTDLQAVLTDPGALFVINHSGGKDSQAMMIRLLKILPRNQIVVVHASLGDMEWPGALEIAEKQAADAGVPFLVARATKTLFEMVERRFAARPEVPSWPSAKYRQCTSDLKRGPIAREVRRYAAARGISVVVNCLGLRAAESSTRAKRSIFTRVASNCTQTRQWFEWLPIHALPTAAVFATIRDAGQTPHPAYTTGNERLSCVFCIMASRADIINGARHNPDLYRRFVDLEQRTGYTMHESRLSLVEIVESIGAAPRMAA